MQIYYCRTIGHIYRYYRTLIHDPANRRVPYFIIQPCLANKKEYKICILSNPHTGEEREPFLCKNPHQKGKAFVNKYDLRQLYEFAKRAKRIYEKKVSHFVYPIFRVDIMRLQNGKFVVNEFESLEALILSGSLGSLKRQVEDNYTDQFLLEYWKKEIISILNL